MRNEAITFPLLGNSVVIGLFSLLHITFAAISVGFMMLAPLLETAEQRDPSYLSMARSLTRFTVVTFSVSTVLAVFMVELSIGLFPLTTMWMWNQFRWPIMAAIAAFLLMLAALYPYYHYWDAIRSRHRWLHIALGWLAALFILVWVAILDGMGSTMLTPDSHGSPWSKLLNPTWLPLVFHRFIGNLVVAGFLITGYAGWRLRRQPGSDDHTYYLTLVRTGLSIGLGGAILQPVSGLLYALQIEEAAPQAYAGLMTGPYQAFIYVQFALIGGLFVGSLLLLQALHVPVLSSKAIAIFVLLGSLAMVFFATAPLIRRPANWLVAALLLWTLVRMGSTGSRQLHQLNRPLIQLTAMGLAVVALLTYWTMGMIRETARRPDTVRGIITLQDEARTPAADRGTPQSASSEF
jgi:cytochrome bd-type quinol oxidase subunit 1